MAKRSTTARDTGDSLTASSSALASALAAVESSAPSNKQPLRWTPDADKVLRAGLARGLSWTRLAVILAPLLGRRVCRITMVDRARALGIA
jgi:hypothetical protein